MEKEKSSNSKKNWKRKKHYTYRDNRWTSNGISPQQDRNNQEGKKNFPSRSKINGTIFFLIQKSRQKKKEFKQRILIKSKKGGEMNQN